MYTLLVRWFDNSTMTRNIKDAEQLGRLTKQLKGGITFAELTTPSGVTKEVTKFFV
jgi:hypothetical protein